MTLLLYSNSILVAQFCIRALRDQEQMVFEIYRQALCWKAKDFLSHLIPCRQLSIHRPHYRA